MCALQKIESVEAAPEAWILPRTDFCVRKKFTSFDETRQLRASPPPLPARGNETQFRDGKTNYQSENAEREKTKKRMQQPEPFSFFATLQGSVVQYVVMAEAVAQTAERKAGLGAPPPLTILEAFSPSPGGWVQTQGRGRCRIAHHVEGNSSIQRPHQLFLSMYGGTP